MNPLDDDRETVLDESERKYNDENLAVYYDYYHKIVLMIEDLKKQLKRWMERQKRGDNYEAPYRIRMIKSDLKKLEDDRKQVLRDFKDFYHRPMFIEAYMYSHEDLPPFEISRKRRRSEG